MSRPALKTALRLLKTYGTKERVQRTLQANGIIFKIDEQQSGLPEIISEETFVELLQLQAESDDDLPTSIYDEGWENDDLDDDGLTFVD